MQTLQLSTFTKECTNLLSVWRQEPGPEVVGRPTVDTWSYRVIDQLGASSFFRRIGRSLISLRPFGLRFLFVICR